MKIFILGAGGHAQVIQECLASNNQLCDFFIVQSGANLDSEETFSSIAENQFFETFLPTTHDDFHIYMGVGFSNFNSIRKDLFFHFVDKGYHFKSIIHNAAYVAKDVVISRGAQILAGSVIMTGSSIGENTIINTRTSIDHHCSIGQHSHICPGVTICGGVSVGNGTFIGPGAVIARGVEIGNNVTIGAGSTVTKNIEDNTKFIQLKN